MDTVLVTGACGTLGRWTVDRLRQDNRVVGVDRQQPSEPTTEIVEYLAGDLTQQGTAWELITDIAPETVVHLAAVPGAGHRSGTETFMTNVAATYNVLTAAGEAGADVVWSSSESTYGVTFRDRARPLNSLPIDETHPQRPEDAYGLSKVVGEIIADRTIRHYDISVCSLEPSWIQVPGEYETPAVREAFSLDNPTPSGSLWSYIDVRDVAQLIADAVGANIDGHERYIAAAENNYIDVPTAEAIEAAWGSLPEDCSLSGEEAGFSTAKADRDLDWQPRHSWQEAETDAIERPSL